MLGFVLMCTYLSGVAFILGLMPVEFERRATLKTMGLGLDKKKKSSLAKRIFTVVRRLSKINAPLVQGVLRRRISKDLMIAHVNMNPEEFILLKETLIAGLLFVTFPTITAEFIVGWIGMCFVFGYMLPEFWLKGRIKRVKAVIVKELPDAIDLLGLCVNAGLDFMLSLKWVVEKSPKSVMVDELNTVLQEINVGKTRREAIKDLARRYELPDLSTFTRTLIQADKMGTSVTEALNIISEEMRLARYRRGEQLALKAPLKMLVPLLIFIFPVVGILVAGPIMLDFIENNPFDSVGGR